MDKHIENLVQVAKTKLEELGEPVNPNFSILIQLMHAVFNTEEPHNLEMKSWVEDDLHNEIYVLMKEKDRIVIRVMVPEPEDMDILAERISEAQTEDDLRDILIVELLQDSMRQNSDWDPFAS